MKSLLKISFLVLLGFLFLAADAKKVSKPKSKSKENLNGIKVSKAGKGKSYMKIFMSVSYKDYPTDRGAQTYSINKVIQINDTELVSALPFTKKNKAKVTYDDLRYEVVNRTKISTFLDYFAEESLEYSMSAERNLRVMSDVRASLPVSDTETKTETVVYKPSGVHWKSKDALAGAVLPSYLIIGILALIAYVGRAKIFSKSGPKLLKLSNVSRLLAKFVYVRIIFDIIYLAYLVLFIHFKFFYTNGFLYFCFLAADELINLVAFYYAIAMFCQGYLTLYQDRKAQYKPITIGLTVLYALSITLVEIIYKTKLNKNNFMVNSKVRTPLATIEPTSVIAPFIVLSKLAIFCSGSYFTYETYKSAQKPDKRFVFSAVAIAAAYYFSFLISFPIFRSVEDFTLFLRAKFLAVSPSIFLPKSEAPQVIQLAVVCWLIYYWRDTDYDKVSGDDQENSYELQ